MEKRLERDEANKVIAGVASGLAEYLDMDISLVRLIFILLAIFGSAGIWIYIILWIVVPVKAYTGFDGFNPSYRGSRDYPFSERTERYTGPADPGSLRPVKRDDTTSVVVGLILLFAGMYFLLDQFRLIPYWFSIAKLWPIGFIIVGLVFLLKPGKKKTPDPYTFNKTPEQEPEKKDNEVSIEKPGEKPLSE